VNSLIASFPSVVMAAGVFAVGTVAAWFWRRNEKLYALLAILGSVVLGLWLAPTWTLAALITCGLLFAASFVRTTGATIVTALILLGIFYAFALSLT